MLSDSQYHQNERILASPGIRLIGINIDFLFSAAIFSFLLWVVPKLGFVQVIASEISFFTAVMCFLLSDGLPNGQSLGKKLLGISTISIKSGKYCSFTQSFFRNVLFPIIGIIDAVFILGKKRQRLGDKLAKTVVVKK
ncbi:hypothetical protein BS333_17155 [Vibrio azureus]|uniref:RDD domain-containing protein n=1 Tax=Vibrio azureus NBRC 104587 TaxID=1219077 RepID=U3A4T4_9VIBR|nr:RDD family protein [Vibrio azureus]AUI88097.1 hypothetical protein BS333_17155 [Vibrio azureus]GAD75021.1 hypothetical protein VAZ01S_017_01160 [Vibrio azureus NBRC 104587]